MRRPALLLLLGALLAGSASAQPLRSDLYSANGPVHAAVELNGILYIGGEFFEVGIPTGAGVPIDPSTGLPQSMPKVVGTVRAVVSDGAGGWYIGGLFTHVGGLPRQNLAHILSDYSVAPWNPATGPAGPFGVNALLVANGMVYVGGNFNSLGGQPRNNVGAVDAVTGVATSWYPNCIGEVMCLARDGSVVYIGGSYTTIAGQARANLSAFDAITAAIQPWNPGANSAVKAMTVNAGKVYVGGIFTSAGGQTRNRLAAFNGVSGNVTAWNPNVNSTVDALVANGNVIYAGGFFTTVGVTGRVGIAALDTAGAGTATGWNPNANGAVNALAVQGSTVYAGGAFTNIGGQTRFRIGAVDASSGFATSWNPRTSAIVRAIGSTPGTVFVGGEFNSVGGQTRPHLAAIDLATGQLTSWNPNADNAVKALVVSGSTIYVGGHFTNVGGQTRVGIAALDATTGLATSWNPGASAAVYALALDGGTIYAGGEFGTLGGVGRGRIGAINVATGAATTWNPGATGGAVHAILVSDSVVYAGGQFTGFGGQPRNKAGAARVGTGTLTAWNPNPTHTVDPNFVVRALAASDGVIYLGGEFNTVGGLPRSGLAAVDPTSGAVTPWNPAVIGPTVHALYATPGTVIAGGDFFQVGGQPRLRLAAIESDTGRPLNWDPQANGLVRVITPVLGHLYVGGLFTGVGGYSNGAIAGIRPVLVGSDLTVTEGGGKVIPVRLLPPGQPAIVEYTTVPGTATSPADYTAASGTLIFDTGNYLRNVMVNVNSDGLPEFNETFSLGLSVDGPSPVTVHYEGVVTIADDDSAGIQCRDFPSVMGPVLGQVYAMAVLNGVLYIGGDFDTVFPPNGPAVIRHNLAAINLATGEPTSWAPEPNSIVRALYATGGTIYAGGDFNFIGGQARYYIAALDAATGLATSWDPDADGGVRVLAGGAGGTLYVGGDFSYIGGNLRPFLAALDVTSDFSTAWAPNANNKVYELAVASGVVYAGGIFQSIGGQTRLALAAVDTGTALATSFDAKLKTNFAGPGGEFGPEVTALLVHGGAVYAGGFFNETNGIVRRKIAALDPVTGIPTSWNPNAAGDDFDVVHAMVPLNGRMYVGGYLTSIGLQPRNGLAAIDLVTGLADPFAPDAYRTLVLATAGGRIYAGGMFNGALACYIPVANVDVPDPTAGIEPTLRLSPNPARSLTHMEFTIPRAGYVSIEVFDVQGRSVSTPVDGSYEAGPHRATWTSPQGAGLYFVRFSALGRSFTRRLIVLQ